MGDQLTDFLRARKEKAAHPTIDWQEKKAAWIHAIESLYDKVGNILEPSIASGDVTIQRFETEVNENFVGRYSVPVLELTIGGERVEFRPKGITVIGASGRVDLRGEGDTVTLLWDSAQAESGWTVIVSRVPHLQMTELDRDSLKYALERVMLPLP